MHCRARNERGSTRPQTVPAMTNRINILLRTFLVTLISASTSGAARQGALLTFVFGGTMLMEIVILPRHTYSRVCLCCPRGCSSRKGDGFCTFLVHERINHSCSANPKN